MSIESFILRALLAAALLGPLCGFLGVFVTARKMSFFSDTVAHSSVAGVALGFWFGLTDPTVPMILCALLVAIAVLWLRNNTDLLPDTTMALLLSGSVALGIVIMSQLKNDYRGELHAYLFGDIITLGNREVILAGILSIIVLTFLVLRLNQITLLTVHEELAQVCGISVRLWNYWFVLVLTLTVTLSIRILGIILVTSLLVIPPATARNVSQNLRQQIRLSVMVAWVSGLLGVILSCFFEFPSGPLIVLTSLSAFILSLIWNRCFTQARKRTWPEAA